MNKQQRPARHTRVLLGAASFSLAAASTVAPLATHAVAAPVVGTHLVASASSQGQTASAGAVAALPTARPVAAGPARNDGWTSHDGGSLVSHAKAPDVVAAVAGTGRSA